MEPIVSLHPLIEFLIAVHLLIGAIFIFIGSLGLVKLRDIYTRLHGPTKATTLGVGGTLIASSIFFTATAPGVSLHEVLVTFFLFMTAPVSAHLMAKTALHLGIPNVSGAEEKPAGAPIPGGESTRDSDAADVLRS